VLPLRLIGQHIAGGSRRARPLRILLLCSSFNGLCQRVWTDFCAAGQRVTVQVAADQPTLKGGGAGRRPRPGALPFPAGRIPETVWQTRRRSSSTRARRATGACRPWTGPSWSANRHPGPPFQAVQEIDAGPIWPSRNFPRPGGPAAQLILEVITKAADPDFRPEPGDYTRPDVWGAQGTHRRTDDDQPLHTSGVVDAAPANGRETSAN